jgi:hypothetical protein
MRPITRILALAILGMATWPATAQNRAGSVEITPFGGAYFGGRLRAGSNALFSSDVDVSVAGTYGLRLGMNVTRSFALELGFSTAKADIEGRGSGLFGDGQKLGELDVKHYELDAVFNVGRRRVIPYFAIGGGATTFKARVTGGPETDEDTRFTGNLGFGVKTFFTPNVGLRFDGRVRAAYIDDSRDCSRGSIHCDDRDRDRDDDRRWYGSGEVTAGLTFAF